MKNALIKDFFRELRHSTGRFLAIFAITALGVGFFAGLKATCPDIRLTADTYFDKQGAFDLYLLSEIGFDADDVAAVRETEGVAQAAPGYSVDAIVQNGEDERTAKLISLAEDAAVNRPVLVEGRLPERPDECVVDSAVTLSGAGASIGDTIIISDTNSESTLDMLSARAFTVVGTVSSPLYVSFERGNTDIGNGSISMFIMLPEEAFSSDYYTELYVTADGASALNAYDEDYTALIERISDRLTETGTMRCAARYDDIVTEMEQKLADGEAELADAESEGREALDKARSRLDDARAEIQSNEKQLRDGRAELAESRAAFEQREQSTLAELAEGEAQIADAKAQLEASAAQLSATRGTLDAAAAELSAARQQIEALSAAGQTEQAEALAAALAPKEQELAAGEQEYAAGYAAYEAGVGQLAEQEQQLAEGRAALESGRAALSAAEAELADGEAQLARARRQLDQGEREYAENYLSFSDEIADARAKLEDGRAELADFEAPEWYVLDRGANIGMAGLVQNIDRVDAVAAVFPVFFFLVAALVCLTTMTRMVEEQRTEIGVLKALGYGKGRIVAKYLCYAIAASVTGSLVGLLIGFQVFPRVIWNAYQIIYASMPSVIAPFHMDYAVLSTLAAILCTGLSSFLACLATLRESPAALMRPRPPKNGKRVLLERVPFIWRRLSFTHKITVRNLMRYKKRFFMTVVGISGCTALMLTGFGLKDSIGAVVGKQYDEIVRYEMVARVDSGHAGEALQTLAGDKRVGDCMAYFTEAVDITHGGDTESIYLFVPQSREALSDFITLRERRGDALSLPKDSALLTEKAASLLGVSVGDTLCFTADGADFEVRVAGITENYIYHYLYLSPELYEQLAGKAPAFNQIAARVGDGTGPGRDAIAADLLATGDFQSVSFTTGLRSSFEDMLHALDYVVLVLILCAALLSFVVLYNLTNINITERIREIATIKVLGFYDREVSAYVYRENVALTAIGAAVGLVLGIALHRFVILVAELDIVMFGREIAWPSYLYSLLLTALFAALVNFVMHYRLRRISMVESLKSVE